MPDDQSGHGKAPIGSSGHGFNTRLSHAGRPGTRTHGFVNPAVMRGSTVLYPSCADRTTLGAQRLEQALIYGVLGNPTHHALENVVAEIEGGTRCQIVSSGLAAVTTPLLAYLGTGDHVLVPDSCYGPTRSFCDGLLHRMGVSTTYYEPTLDGPGLEPLMQPNTKVVFTESPGSHSFEMQDIPALAAVAHAHGAKVLMDNTWGIHHFQPFRHGVDVSIQALTKYVAGHSDVLLGSITTASDEDWQRVRMTALTLGQYASPDDCWLALRGVRTMGVRLRQQEQSGIEVAKWFAGRPEVAQVLHPALPGAPGHDIWLRDFTGACSLFGVMFQPEYSLAAVHSMIDRLELFGIGASWGGFESLVLPTTGHITRTAGGGTLAAPSGTAGTGPVARFHIGLEDVADLLADLDHGMAVLRAHAG